jgi:hypothetical protein
MHVRGEMDFSGSRAPAPASQKNKSPAKPGF